MVKKSRNLSNQHMKVKKFTSRKQLKAMEEKKFFFEKPLFLLTVILGFTTIAFLPSLKNDFMPTWDDILYVTNNPMIWQLDQASFKAMFSTPVNSTYVPLTLLSFAVEYHFFGLDPHGYHVTNLLLHLICTLLVFLFLRRLKLDAIYATFGAVLFGIHPMHVESVAWITERKDLLYSLFYLCSMNLYLIFVQKGYKTWRYLFLSILFFILSLFSKIQAVTLPLSLLLVDYLLERPLKSRLILEKIPYLILSLVFGIAGILILKQHGTLDTGDTFSFFQRMLLGLYALSAYLIKFIDPFHLSASYPFPVITGQYLPALYYLNLVFLLAVAFIVYRSVRYTRAVLFGSLFFLFNIMFLLQVYRAGYAYMADRFSYIPYIGLAFIAGWSLYKIAPLNNVKKYMVMVAMSIILVLFASMASDRCKVWKNGETLWTDVLEKYPEGNAVAYSNHGLICEDSGQLENALADYSKAIEINPKYTKAYYNLGNVNVKLSHLDKAIVNYTKAIEIRPKFVQAYFNRGLAYGNLGRFDKALDDFNRVIEIDPGFTMAYTNRDVAIRHMKDMGNR